MSSRRRRYTREERAGALGALEASVPGLGEPPRFHSVGRALGIPIQTLHRWWNGRNPDEDGMRRDAASRARARAAELGAEDWLQATVRKAQQGISAILDADPGSLDLDKRARAIKLCLDGVEAVARILERREAAEPEPVRAVSIQELRERVRRSGLERMAGTRTG